MKKKLLIAILFSIVLLAAGFYETSENPWGLACFHHDETNINIRIVYNEELVDLFIFRNL